MTDYEILLLLDAELPGERQEEIVARARELIERGGGTFEGHDAWGRRRLAYEIDRKAEGAYHLLTFTSDSAALDEVSRVLKITDGVLRHMAVRRPAPKRPVSESAPAVQPPVRASGPAEGARGNRDVSAATTEGRTTNAPTTEAPTSEGRAAEGPTTEAPTAEAEGAVSVGQPDE